MLLILQFSLDWISSLFQSRTAKNVVNETKVNTAQHVVLASTLKFIPLENLSQEIVELPTLHHIIPNRALIFSNYICYCFKYLACAKTIFYGVMQFCTVLEMSAHDKLLVCLVDLICIFICTQKRAPFQILFPCVYRHKLNFVNRFHFAKFTSHLKTHPSQFQDYLVYPKPPATKYARCSF